MTVTMPFTKPDSMLSCSFWSRSSVLESSVSSSRLWQADRHKFHQSPPPAPVLYLSTGLLLLAFGQLRQMQENSGIWKLLLFRKI